MRLKLGDRVQITASEHDGFMKPGDIGEIITDDHSGMPFQVRFEGHTHWYHERDLRLAIASSTKDVRPILHKY